MRGPFELHIDDGNGERIVTGQTRGLKFSRSAYGGDKGLSGTVRVQSGTFTDLGPGDTVRLDDRRTGEPLWTGEATHPGEQTGPGGDAYDLVALGGANRLQAAATPLGYVVHDMTEWVRSGNSTKGSQTQESERGEDVPTLEVSWNDGKNVNASQMGEWIYRPLKRAGLDVGYVFANIDCGLNSSNYVLRVMVGPAMTSLRSGGLARNASTTVSELVAHLNTDVLSGDQVVTFRVARNNSARTATDDDWFRFFNIVLMQARVDQFGARDTSTYNGTVTASQVIADMVGRGMCPGLDPELTTITETTFGIDELSWLEGVTMGDALDELLHFEPNLTWRVAGPTGVFDRFDFDNPRYVIGDRHGGIEQSGSDDDVRCNEVLVTWTDRKGKERTTLVTREVEGLYRRSYLPGLQLPDGFGSEANAQRAGEQLLTAVNRGPRAGRAVIREPIFDEWAGCMVHPAEILPGHVAMKHSTGETLKVTGMEYDDDDEATTLELDRPPRTPEQILARLKRRRRRRK